MRSKFASLCLAAVCVLVAGCQREQRSFETPESGRLPLPLARGVSIQPGTNDAGLAATKATGATTDPRGYDGNAYAVSQGKRLFRWYNCSGCHANGGGGMGPPLMDAEWRYGSEPAQIFQSIVQGRPNGMPSFGGHIPEDQVWQLVAYVRSMSGQLHKDAAPSRSDSLAGAPPENTRPQEKSFAMPASDAVPTPASPPWSA